MNRIKEVLEEKGTDLAGREAWKKFLYRQFLRL